jgi:cell wall-associated NlpC family hydrolase
MMSGYLHGKQTRNMRFIVLMVLAGFLAVFFSGSASAAPSAITTAAAELEALAQLVEELSADLEAAAEDYNYANQQYEDTKAAADEATANLKQAESDLAAARERLCERLVGIYKSGDIAALEALLSADSVADALGLMDDLRSLAQEDSRLVDEVQGYKNLQAQLQAKLDADLVKLAQYKEEAAAAQQKVQAQLAKQQQALKGKESQLAQLRKAEAERQARLAEQARQYKIWLASRPGKVVSLARSYLGVPYVWGGSSPSGFDCSGLAMYVYSKVGIKLPHSSRLQYNYGKPVSKTNLKAGDLVFFYSPIHHVGIYIGNGKMIDATGNKVQISNVFTKNYVGARRLL